MGANWKERYDRLRSDALTRDLRFVIKTGLYDLKAARVPALADLVSGGAEVPRARLQEALLEVLMHEDPAARPEDSDLSMWTGFGLALFGATRETRNSSAEGRREAAGKIYRPHRPIGPDAVRRVPNSKQPEGGPEWRLLARLHELLSAGSPRGPATSTSDLGVQARSSDVKVAPQALGSAVSQTMLGCWLGRRTVACGALSAPVPPTESIPDASEVSIQVEPKPYRLPIESAASSQIYDRLAEHIHSVLVSLVDSQALPVAGIGIGTPGVIETFSRRIRFSVTLPEDWDLATQLATRLISRDGALIERCCGLRSVRQLAQRIYVDNDVRCVARDQQSQGENGNFACMYAGAGVGGAFVIHDRLYHGVRGNAAHVGHLELGSATGTLLLATGHALAPLKCSCGVEGFHLEAVASYAGLEAIAGALATEEQGELLELARESYLAKGGVWIDFFRDVFPVLLGNPTGGKSDGGDAPGDYMSDLKGLTHLFDAILVAYADLLARGLATVVNLMDPEQIVLCGPIVEQLGNSALFARRLRRDVADHVFYPESVPSLKYVRIADSLWRGAALIPWDPVLLGR